MPTETKVCCLGGGKTRCAKIGEGFAGTVWRPVTNTLSSWIRIEPPTGRAFSVYVPGIGQAGLFLRDEPPPWWEESPAYLYDVSYEGTCPGVGSFFASVVIEASGIREARRNARAAARNDAEQENGRLIGILSVTRKRRGL